MLENVKTQIANALGGDFRIFWNTAHEDIETTKHDESKVVAVAYENFGTYSAIENSIAYDGNIIFEFAIPSQDKVLYDGYIAKINEVIQSKNAQFEVVAYDENGGKQQVINYVLVFDGLRVSGNEEDAYGVMRQPFVLSVKVSASPDIAFGNKTIVEIKNNVNQWLQLENCVSVDFVGQQQTIQKVVTASFEAGNVPQYEISRIVVTYMYKQESELHEIIQHRYMSGIDASYQLRLRLNHDVLTFTAVCASYVHNNPTGGFQTIQVEFVRADIDNERPNYVLTIGNTQNGSLTVTRGGFRLYNGDIIVPGDELQITATPNAGYILKRLQANSANVSNGGIYIVTSDTTVTAEFIESIVQTWTVKIKQGTGTDLSVKNGETIVTNDAIINDGTVLTITATAMTGFDVDKITVNGTTLSGNSYTVRSDVDIESLGELENRKIDAIITVPQGQSARDVVVKGYKIRDYFGTDFSELVIDTATNDYTYTGKYGDVLKMEYIVATSSSLRFKSFKFNGSNVANFYEATLISDNNIIACDAEFKPFKLSVFINGANWNIKRGDEFLQDGATISVGDVLTVIFSAFSGYTLSYVDVNDFSVTSGQSFTVDGQTIIEGTAYSTITYRKTTPVTSRQADYGSQFTIIDGHQWDTSDKQFLWWTTQPNGIGTRYTAGETYRGGDMTLYWWGATVKKKAYIDMYLFTKNGNQYCNIRLNQTPNGSKFYNATSKITLDGTYRGTELYVWNGTIEVGAYQTGEVQLFGTDGKPVTFATIETWKPQSDSTYDYVKGGIYYLS